MNENLIKDLNDLIKEEEDLYDPEQIEEMKANGKAAAQRLFMAFTNIMDEVRESESATETAAFLNELLGILYQIVPKEKIVEVEEFIRKSAEES